MKRSLYAVAILAILAAGMALAQTYPRWSGSLTGIADWNGTQFSTVYPFPFNCISGCGGGSGSTVTANQGTQAASSTGSTWFIQPGASTSTVSASNAVTSLVLKASASVGVQYFHAEVTGGAAGYCILYNGTTAPSTGALTAANVLAFQSFPAATAAYCDWTATALAIAASNGAVVLISTAASPFTYTTGTDTAAIYGYAP